MKSFGGLFAKIVSFENLEAAADRAARGKRHRPAVAYFLERRDEELRKLQDELVTRSYQPRPYTQFSINDPKPRLISCADFRDRVVHHAVCSILSPFIERRLIHDTYACRKGKGSHLAVLRGLNYSRKHPYFLKTDIHKYFNSIDHLILIAILEKLFRESSIRELLKKIILHPLPGQNDGRGLPIGNLTSQWFANLYLDRLDHWIKEQWRISGYVRYMDDFVLWCDDKHRLFMILAELQDYLEHTLDLSLNWDHTLIAPVSEGLSFLGYRIFPNFLRQQPTRLRRRRRLLKRRENEYLSGKISESKLTECIRAVNGTREFFATGEAFRSGLEI
jgi:RNA-directed DNA polymerase